MPAHARIERSASPLFQRLRLQAQVQEAHRFAICALPGRAPSGGLGVTHGRRVFAGAAEMVGQRDQLLVRQLADGLGVTLEGGPHATMQLPPVPKRNGLVARRLQQRVRKPVGVELGAVALDDPTPASGLQRARHVDRSRFSRQHRLDQPRAEALADDARNLQHAVVRGRQTIEADRAFGGVGVGLPFGGARLGEAAGRHRAAESRADHHGKVRIGDRPARRSR